MTKIFSLGFLSLASADILLQRSWSHLDPENKRIANNIWSFGDNQGNPPTYEVDLLPEFTDTEQPAFHVSFDVDLRANYESPLWRSLFNIGNHYDINSENYQYPRLGKNCGNHKKDCVGCTTGIYYGRKGHYAYIDMKDADPNNVFVCRQENPLITEDPIPSQNKQCICAGQKYESSSYDRTLALYFQPNGKWADRSKDWDLALLQSCDYSAPWDSNQVSKYTTDWWTGEKHHIEIFYDTSKDNQIRVYLDGELTINESKLDCGPDHHQSGRRQVWVGTPWVNTWREGLAGVDVGNFMYNDEITEDFTSSCLVSKPVLSSLEVGQEEVEIAEDSEASETNEE